MASVEGRCTVSNTTRNGRDVTGRHQQPNSEASSPPPRVRPRKALGQHFLVDRLVLDSILSAADLTPDDLVLEIGPGLGALTRSLAEQAGRVVAVEMDDQLAATLPARVNHPPNLTVVHGDARNIDLQTWIGHDNPYKVVANLPYYAANPIVRRFLESEQQPQLLVVMVQQEVARTMLAGPGKMGLLSVATQFYAVPKLVCDVPPAAFRPPPKVTSSVLRLDLRRRPAVDVGDPVAFFDLVRAGFSAPRKQLANSLSQGLDAPRALVGKLLEELDLDARRRAETLSLDEWTAVFHGWQELSKVGAPSLR